MIAWQTLGSWPAGQRRALAMRRDPVLRRLTGAFGPLKVTPLRSGNELVTVAGEMENCAALFRADLEAGRSVFLVGRDSEGRARLLCRLVQPGAAEPSSSGWRPPQLGSLSIKEVKRARNRRLSGTELEAWHEWLGERGVTCPPTATRP